jgi:hypothetical protein
MREQPERGYFLDQEAKVHHAKRTWGEAKGFKPITRGEAEAICGAKRAHAKVISLVPPPSPGDDPLPRFLTPQSDTIAPEMLARAKEFEAKVVAVLEQSRKVMDASHMDVTHLAERVSTIESTLANLAVAVKTAREGREE